MLDPLVIVSLMIHNLSDQYALTKALLQDKEREVLTFEYVRSKLMEAEKQLQEQGTVKAYSVTQKQIMDDVKQKGKPRPMTQSPPIHAPKQMPSAGPKRQLPPCTYCGKAGHNTERCWERRAEEWRRNNPGHPVPGRGGGCVYTTCMRLPPDRLPYFC